MPLDKRIEAIDVDDGRKIVMLRPGWRYADDGDDNDRRHSFGADTNREIRFEMKNVRPCTCRDCQKALAPDGSGKLWS